MIDVAPVVCDYLEANMELPFALSLDLIQDAEKNGACIRHDPTQAAERSFTDGSRLIVWNLALYVRMKDAAKAREWTNAIIERLDGFTIEDKEKEIEIKCEAVALAQFVDTDDKGMTTYTGSFSAAFLEE